MHNEIQFLIGDSMFRIIVRNEPYNLYCVGADVKPCSISQSNEP